MPKSILLSIDLSDPQSSNQALKGALSKDFKKTALLRFGQALRQWTQEKVPESVNARPHVLHGTVYHEVLMAADKLRVDVIVVSAHRPAFKDYFLGPNAARIVRHAKQSVYVVRNQLTCQTTFLGALPAAHYPLRSAVTVAT